MAERKTGWLGYACPRCKGAGQIYLEHRDNEGPCPACAGTGEAYGPVDPSEAMPSSENVPDVAGEGG